MQKNSLVQNKKEDKRVENRKIDISLICFYIVYFGKKTLGKDQIFITNLFTIYRNIFSSNKITEDFHFV